MPHGSTVEVAAKTQTYMRTHNIKDQQQLQKLSDIIRRR